MKRAYSDFGISWSIAIKIQLMSITNMTNKLKNVCKVKVSNNYSHATNYTFL